MQAVLSEVDVERYAREGYLTAPSVLSPDELASCAKSRTGSSPSARGAGAVRAADPMGGRSPC